MSTQIPKKRAILFILITLNVHEIQLSPLSAVSLAMGDLPFATNFF